MPKVEIKEGRETDLLVAKKLFTFVTSPDDWGKNEIWFWFHPRSGILIGFPYTNEFMEGSYAHSWEEFKPSTNMIHATFVINYFHERNKPVTITDTLNAHGTNWFVKIDQGKYVEDKSLELAICKAIFADSYKA